MPGQDIALLQELVSGRQEESFYQNIRFDEHAMRVHIGILNRELEEKNQMMAEKYDEDSQNQTLKKGQDFNALILEQ